MHRGEIVAVNNSRIVRELVAACEAVLATADAEGQVLIPAGAKLVDVIRALVVRGKSAQHGGYVKLLAIGEKVAHVEIDFPAEVAVLPLGVAQV